MDTASGIWTHYWLPRGENLAVWEDQLIPPPEEEIGRTLNPHLVRTRNVLGKRCLLFLGDPGSGKSTALRSELPVWSREAAGSIFIGRDLRDYASVEELDRDTFDSEELAKAIRSGAPIQLFLDSFDEAQIRLDRLAQSLGRRLRQLPPMQVSLRIASRTNVLSAELEALLRNHWGDKEFGAYELAPLTRKAVEEAAAERGVAPGPFLSKVKEAGAVPLAWRPITLGLLLDLYQEGAGGLPASRAELYEKGCLRMCSEPDPERRARLPANALAREECVAVARRLAALSIFSQRPFLLIERDAEARPGTLLLSEVVGGTKEPVGPGRSIEVGRQEVLQVAGTQLLSEVSGGQFAWAHRSFAEYLAARYLVERKASRAQVESLLTIGDRTGLHLVPQLRGVAGWFSALNAEFAERLVEIEPQALLGFGLGRLRPESKRRLVAVLLERLERKELTWVQLLLPFHEVSHAELGSQLRSSLTQGQSRGTQAIALEIALDAKVREVVPEALRIAHDNKEAPTLRAMAVRAVKELGGPEDKGQLVPLLRVPDGEDPEREILGAVLATLWPEGVQTPEVIAALKAPAPDHAGSYDIFLGSRMFPTLDGAQLCTAISWLQGLGRQRGGVGWLWEVLMLRAWDLMEQSSVLDALSGALRDAMGDHNLDLDSASRDRLGGLWTNDEAGRRRVLRALLESSPTKPEEDYALESCLPPESLARDLDWLATLIDQAAPTQLGERAAVLVEHFLLRERLTDGGLMAMGTSPKDRIRALAHRGSLSEQAVLALRRRAEAAKDEKAQRVVAIEAAAQRVRQTGQNLRQLLEAMAGERERHDWVEPSELQGWKVGTPLLRTAILDAIQQALLKRVPSAALRSDEQRVLEFLAAERPEALDALPNTFWKVWLEAVANRVAHRSARRSIFQLLFDRARSAWPEMYEGVAKTLLALGLEQSRVGALLRILPEPWPDAVSALTLDGLTRGILKPSDEEEVLESLLRQEYAGARAIAMSLLQASGGVEAKRVAAALALFLRPEPVGLGALLEAMEANPAFGLEVVRRCASFLAADGQMPSLTPNQVGQIVTWMARHGIPAPGYRPPRSGIVTSEWELFRFRQTLFTYLRDLGRAESVVELERLGQAFPGEEEIPFALVQARMIEHERRWRPVRPEHLLALFSKAPGEARLVETGAQLLEVILESLGRIQADFHGANPLAPLLWDLSGPNRTSGEPKYERHLSDLVAALLRRDLSGRGVIINREVDVASLPAVSAGERVDIKVDAVAREEHDPTYRCVTVIIECKRSLNDELWTAMETQLCLRYLRERTRDGIYLVGWYADGGRVFLKSHAVEQQVSSERAAELLAQQAAQLSTRHGVNLRVFVLDASLGRSFG